MDALKVMACLDIRRRCARAKRQLFIHEYRMELVGC
jgi:hypothetical protein